MSGSATLRLSSGKPGFVGSSYFSLLANHLSNFSQQLHHHSRSIHFGWFCSRFSFKINRNKVSFVNDDGKVEEKQWASQNIASSYLMVDQSLLLSETSTVLVPIIIISIIT